MTTAAETVLSPSTGSSHAATERPRRPVLRGRRDELDLALNRLRRATSTGAAEMIVLPGSSGLGKTALLREIVEQARRQGYAVGCGAVADRPLTAEARGGDPQSPTPPMAPLIEALRSGDEPLLSHEEFLKLGALHDQVLWFVDRLATILERRTADCSVLVALDDVHRADVQTLFALTVLSQRLAGCPIVWVLSMQDSPGPADEVAASAASTLPITTVALGPLDQVAVLDLATDRLGHDPDPVLRRLLDGAGGIPGLLVRLLDEIAVSPVRADATGDQLPTAFVGCVRGYLEAGLGAETVRLMRVGAVLGRFRLEDAAAVLGVPLQEVVSAIDAAVHRGVLVDDGEHVQFELELVRRAIYEGIPRSARRLMHSTTANYLRSSGRSVVDAAPHVVATARPGDTEAVRLLREAAEALADRDRAGALDLSQHAFDLLDPTDPDWVDAGAEVVWALARTGQHRQAVEVAERIMDSDLPADARGRVVVALAGSLLALGERPRLRATVELALASDLSDDTRLQVTAAGILAQVGEADAARVRTVAAATVRAGRVSGEVLAHATALQALGELALDDGRFLGALDHFRDVRALTGILTPEEIETLVIMGDLDRADLELRRFRPGVVGELEPGVALARARGMLARGEVARANAVSVELLRQVCPGDEPVIHSAVAAFAGEVAHLQGRPDEARAHLVMARADGGEGNLALEHLAARLLAVAGGTAGRHIRDALLPVLTRSRRGDPAQVVSATRQALAAGDHSTANELARIAGSVAVRNPLVARLSALADQATALVDGDLDLLEAVVRRLQSSPRPLDHAAATADFGRVLLERGQRARGIGELDRAWAAYRRIGADGEAVAIRRLLRAAGVRRHRWPTEPARPTTGWASLTSAEVRVAELVAAGLSNREVAARLVVSPNTVATHLRSTFGKLHVTSRVQLTRIALERSNRPPGSSGKPPHED